MKCLHFSRWKRKKLSIQTCLFIKMVFFNSTKLSCFKKGVVSTCTLLVLLLMPMERLRKEIFIMILQSTIFSVLKIAKVTSAQRHKKYLLEKHLGIKCQIFSSAGLLKFVSRQHCMSQLRLVETVATPHVFSMYTYSGKKQNKTKNKAWHRRHLSFFVFCSDMNENNFSFISLP